MVFANSKLILVVVMGLGALGAGGAFHQSRVSEEVSGRRKLGSSVPEPVVASGTQKADEKPPLSGLAEKERRHRLLLAKLEKPIDMQKGLELKTFAEAKLYFEEHFDVTLQTDFRSSNAGENLLEAEVRLDKMSGIPLRIALQRLVNQIGALYLVRQDFIEIVTPELAQPASWTTSSFAPNVHAEFQEVPLDDALRELSLDTGISVILDRRALEQKIITVSDRGEVEPIQMPRVTASFDGACLDTAVEILANMCGQKAVALDRVLYVTYPENAKSLEKQQDKRGVTRKPRVLANKSSLPLAEKLAEDVFEPAAQNNRMTNPDAASILL